MPSGVAPYGLTDKSNADMADELRAAADRLRRDPVASPELLAAVADLLQTLSWMPSLAHPADLAAALKVAHAVAAVTP